VEGDGSIEFKRQQWIAESEFRQREVAAKEREQALKEEDLAFAQSSDIPACRNSGSVSRSSARITGPMRCRVTSQRRVPGSHMPPARCRMWAKSCGQRTATMRPNSANSAGPMRAGRGWGERTGDSGQECRAGTIVRTSP
jgi:hypothetical protein